MFHLELNGEMVMIENTSEYSDVIEYKTDLNECLEDGDIHGSFSLTDCSILEIKNKSTIKKTLKSLDNYSKGSIYGLVSNSRNNSIDNNCVSEESLNNFLRNESFSLSESEYVNSDITFEELCNCMLKGEIIKVQFCDDFLEYRLELIIKYSPLFSDLLSPILQHINIALEIHFRLENNIIVAQIFNGDVLVCHFYDVLKLIQFYELCYLLKNMAIFVLE